MSVNFYHRPYGLLLLCFLSISSYAQQVVNFDAVEAPTGFDDQNRPTDDYSDGFASFTGSAEVLVCTPDDANAQGFSLTGFSAPNALKWNNIFGASQASSTQIVEFLDPVEHVSFNIGAPVISPNLPNTIITVQVLDAEGNELNLITQDVTGTSLEAVLIPNSGVSQLVITLPAFSLGCIDDLTYSIVESCSEDFIADAGEDQDLYIGYPPLRTTTLEVDYSGGGGDETILWSTGETTNAIHICPNETTTYTVTVTDANGCQTTDEVIVSVEDVRCGWYGNRVIMCYRGWNFCVKRRYVRFFHYYYGATIGRCGYSSRRMNDDEKPEIDFAEFDQYLDDKSGTVSLEVYPNPASDYININPGMFMDSQVEVSIFDVSGRIVAQSTFDNIGIERLDVSQFESGIYHVRLEDQEGETETLRFVVR